MKRLTKRLTALAIACVLAVMSMPVSVQAACPHDGFQWYSTAEDTHQLSCGMCGDRILPQENHADLDGDGLCDVCKIGIVNNLHTHVWSNQWTGSNAHHFYDCTDSACTTSTGAERHDDSADNDGICDKCGFTVCQHPSQKTDGNGKLVYEPTGPASHHAVCSVCEQTYGNGELHVDNDNNQVCDACGDTVNCLHQNAGRWWDTDEKEHTLYCTCGYPVQPTVAHTDTVKNSDKSVGSDSLCDDCNVYVQLENGELVHKHTVATQWFSDIANTEHFNKCTDNECTRLFNAHTAIDADSDGGCDVCNYSMTNGGQGGGQGGPANQPRFDWAFSIGGFKVPIGGTYTIGVLDGNRPSGSTVDVLLGYVDSNGAFVPYAAADQKGIAIVYDNNGVPTSVTFDGAVIYANNPLAMKYGYFHVAVVVKDANGDIIASNGCDVWLAGYNGGQAGSCTHNGTQWYGTDGPFHELYCGQCGESISNIENHDDADGDTKCDVCGVGVVNNVHNHVWSTQWSSSSMHHFYDCTDSACTTSTGAENHDDSADNDGICDKCGYGATTNPGGGNQNPNQPCVHGHFWVQAEKYGHQTMCGFCGDPCGSLDSHIDANGDKQCDDCWAPLVEENGTLVHNHNKHPHGWYGGTVVHFYKCDTCGMTEFQFESHVDDDHDGICDVCKVSLDANLEHYCTGAMLDFMGLDEDFHAQYCTECYTEYQQMNHVDADSDDLCDDCKVTLDSNDIHVHQPDGNWAEDGKYEHCCKCTECEDWVYESHSDNDGDEYCDICKVDLTCKHDRFQWYGIDEEFHELHCGDCGNSIANMEYHKDADGDTKCDVCGVGVVKNIHTHVWSTAWDHNDTGHWHSCVDSACTTSLSSFAHADDNNDENCDVCGYGNKHQWCQNHWHNGDYTRTDDYHYTLCGDCWNAYGAGIAHYGADGYRVETDKHYPVCVDCWMSYGPGIAHADTDNDGRCDECEEYLGEFKVGGVNYETFDDALDAVNANGGTIVLLKDYTSSKKVNPQITNQVVIDSNGYQFAVTDERFGQLTVETGASLTLTGNGTLYGGNYVIPILVKEGGTLIVEEDFSMDISSTPDVENHGTVIFKGVGKTVYNVGNGVAHIYGSIEAVVNDGGTVHIYDGAVLTGKQFPISNNLKGTVNIYGGTIDGTIAISASSGVINIQGGTILCPLEVSMDNTNYPNDPQIGSYQISGGSFSNGITLKYDYGNDVDLSSLLVKDHCYLLNGAPVTLAPGQMSITGGNVTVGMIAPAPVITKQPVDVEVNLGDRFSISPQVLGNGLTYQWYYKDSYMKDFKVSSNKTPAYAYAMQSYMHERQVYCVITDRYGKQVTTDVATITRPPMELKILSQPEDVCNPIGQKFSVKPQVQGDGLTYQWYYKESYMKNFAVSSNKTSAYAYSMQSYMNERQVYCVITDKYGNQVTTEVATITLPPVELKILNQPADVTAPVGQKFSIKPQVQGDGLTYQWYYKESYMKDFKASSNKSSAYAYAMQSYMNNRQVYCVITDKYGNQVTTDIVTLVLEK